jgi:hypothetical protein
MTDAPLSELALLHRTGSVDDVFGNIMALSHRDLTLTEGQQIQLFMTMLGEPLHPSL